MSGLILSGPGRNGDLDSSLPDQDIWSGEEYEFGQASVVALSSPNLFMSKYRDSTWEKITNSSPPTHILYFLWFTVCQPGL